MPPRLAAKNIEIRYSSEALPVLTQLTLALTPGMFIGIIGPNGSGKSSLVRALSRTLKPSDGAVLLDGQNLYSVHSARASAQAVGVVPQDTSVSLDFSVREMVRMGRAPHLPVRPFASETAEDEEVVTQALQHAGVENLAERPVTALSGGERQRVLLARALAQQPAILLLDEPTANLDLRHQAQVLTLAQSLAHSGGTVLAVLHDVNLAAAYCDTLMLLHEGRITASGTPSEVLTAENLEAVYGARVWVRPHPLSGRPLVLPLPEQANSAQASTEAKTQPSVHVICGGGSGAGLLLALHDLGFPLSVACLHDGDPDADAARLLGIPYANETAFSLLSYAALEQAAQLAHSADIIVLTEVPFGRTNLANLEAALSLRRAGKRILCLHDPSTIFLAARDFTGGRAHKLWSDLLAAGAVILPGQAAVLDYLEHDDLDVGTKEKTH